MNLQNNLNNFDDFDKKLFDFYDTRTIPTSTKHTIKNALLLKNKNPKPKTFFVIKKVAVFIIAIGLTTVSTVFSKDIVNFVNKIFNNSNSRNRYCSRKWLYSKY